ncbi:protein kinase interacting protein [Choristoneura fumiferana multiple nucleopolyhedrovirus]|uniref:Protein kinase interacting protein n=1 Tax=Choristoneura fumiferana nuclear polyhedrosis virus TaxID=208973 RepID=Q9IML9_NPVCF|nr:protein kinase interacting protein [Choristoneura fumiferana multiple nucleopolyhedrovirus]AAF64089.1 protein kinase interacting protein [Choristoneura fumiferana multiple nucleopolyhedrovirus]
METDLAAVVHKKRALLNAALKQQDKKVAKYFVKPCENNAEKMLMLTADIHGQVEQLEALLSVARAPRAEKLAFARDCSDLDIDSQDLQQMCARSDLAYFATKYEAAKVLAPHKAAYDSFLKHSERFIDAVRSLDAPNTTADYLAERKCAAIRHLCTLEYLVGLHTQ